MLLRLDVGLAGVAVEELFEGGGGAAGLVVQDVGVDAQGDGGVGVPEPRGDDVHRAAELYAAELAAHAPDGGNRTVPPFDVLLLGLGPDAHVASLFPSTDPRIDDTAPIRRVTPDPLPPEAPFDRVSLTLPSLLASDRLMFVIRGAAKRRVFDEAAAGEGDLPVGRLLSAARQEVTCFA